MGPYFYLFPPFTWMVRHGTEIIPDGLDPMPMKLMGVLLLILMGFGSGLVYHLSAFSIL